MSFARSVDLLSHTLRRRLARGMLAAGFAIGLTALTLGSPPAAADEVADEAAPAANADSDAQMSRREQRREERRRREAEAAAAELAALEAEANAASEGGREVFLVAVEPELECETVAVTGSRMPKQVCRPVGQAALDEQEAQDFLRRTQERSTRIPPDDGFIRSGMPGFQQ